MTRVLISISKEQVDGETQLITSWAPTESELAAMQSLIQGQGGRVNAREVVVIEREPWSDRRLAELFATYGERAVGVSIRIGGNAP